MDDSTSNVLTLIAALGGAPAIASVIAWSFNRNIKALDERLAALDKENASLRADAKTKDALLSERITHVERNCASDAQKAALADTQISADVKHLSSALAEIKTLLDQMRHSVETTRDKQSDFYNRALKDVEARFEQRVREVSRVPSKRR